MTSKHKNVGSQASALNYFKEVRAELSKVTWPTRQETTRLTIVVVIAAIAFGLAIGGVDYLFTKGIAALLP